MNAGRRAADETLNGAEVVRAPGQWPDAGRPSIERMGGRPGTGRGVLGRDSGVLGRAQAPRRDTCDTRQVLGVRSAPHEPIDTGGVNVIVVPISMGATGTAIGAMVDQVVRVGRRGYGCAGAHALARIQVAAYGMVVAAAVDAASRLTCGSQRQWQLRAGIAAARLHLGASSLAPWHP